MGNRKKIAGGLLAGALFVCAIAPARAEPAKSAAEAALPEAAAVARTCAICHAPSAKARATEGSIPRLQGQPQEALEKALLEFKAGDRAGTIMNRIAKGYSDETLSGVAAYFASQK